MHYHRNHQHHETPTDRESFRNKSVRSRLADLSLVVPFIPVFVVLYGGVLVEYVRWHVGEVRESNNK